MGCFLVRFIKLFFAFIFVTTCLADNLVYVRIEQSVIDKRLQTVRH